MPTQPHHQTDPSAEVPDLDAFIGYNLKRAYILVETDFRAAMGDEGLSPRVFSALSFIVQFPNITQSELARQLGVERSGLVAIVDELEMRGFLTRALVPGDRRVQALIPTAAGRAAHGRALDKVRAHEERFFAGFTEEERQTLLALLLKTRAIAEDTGGGTE
ncbi:MarR family transcriptional regulator [Rhodobacterales bacterium HKCCE3408]|nr:MarR family transcriptional regulator [Rhodobacterales bacterium HKCCE3408]